MEKEPARGRRVVTGSHTAMDGRVTIFETKYDPEALALRDDLAKEMMKSPILLPLVRAQRPDLFKDEE